MSVANTAKAVTTRRVHAIRVATGINRWRQVRRDRSQETWSGITALWIGTMAPARPGRGRLQTWSAPPVALRSVWAAVSMVVSAVLPMVPFASYCEEMSGTRNVEPLTRRPPRIAEVRHTTRAPTPAAYAAAPELVTWAPPLSVHVPVRVPSAGLSRSPPSGMVHVIPEGKKLLIAVKKLTRGARTGDPLAGSL